MKHLVAACLVILFLFSGCVKKKLTGPLEGIIEYDASAVDKNNSLADYAPNKMIFKFKNNKCRAEMSTMMGMFSMELISDSERKKVVQSVRILNQKVMHEYSEKEIEKENNMAPKYKIMLKPEVKKIAGYKCKKAVVEYENGEFPPFDVYYTTDIRITDPNWSTPYKEIKGVLMQYQLKRYGLEMKFTATGVTKTTNESSLFEAPSDYKRVSSKEIDQIFKNFQ